MAIPLPCDTNLIQFVGNPTQWVNVDMVTGNHTFLGSLTPADYVNAIGFNPLDHFIYGYDITVNQVVQVDYERNITYLGRPTGLPANGYNTGCIDLNGFFYLMVNGATRFYTIDLRPDSPTHMRLVNPLNGYNSQMSNYGTALSTAFNPSDWVADDKGFLYGIQPNGVMQRVNLANASVVTLTTNGPNPNASFGAAVIDKNNLIYAIENKTGGIYRYQVDGTVATAEYFSTTYFASQNDGCMCANTDIPLDFGDAPDLGEGNGAWNYNTLLANNGPRHHIANTLYLGTQITAEADAYQNATATGDDENARIQDDALQSPLLPLSLSTDSYSLDVAITNNTGEEAILYGWIDYNRNGLFEPNELATKVVPSTPGTQMITLTFTIPVSEPLSPGETFMRLRLTTDALTTGTDATGQDLASVGPASDGEVEDYIIAMTAMADLELSKTANYTKIQNGETLTYTITITNLGPDTAETPMLTDIAPPELTNISYSLDNGDTWQNWNGTLTLSSIEARQLTTILIQGIVNANRGDTFENTATVTSVTFDPEPSNNSDSTTVKVATIADLSIIKTANPNVMTAGEIITYTLLITNKGPDTSENIAIIDTPPNELLNVEFLTDSKDKWQTWHSPYLIGTLANGATKTILIRGTVASNANNTISNTALLESDTTDPDLTNNTSETRTTVHTAADLAIEKTSDANLIMAGADLTYTLKVTNYGPSDAQNITITDNMPLSVTTTQYYDTTEEIWKSWNGSYSLNTLAANEFIEILVRGTIHTFATGILTNIATVTSDTPDPIPSNNSDSEGVLITPIDASADLSVNKVASQSKVNIGDILTYTITVQNKGPADARGVTLSDSLSTGLTNVEFSLENEDRWQPWVGFYSIGTIKNDTIKTIQIRGEITSQVVGNISNTAFISSLTPDPNPLNNFNTVDSSAPCSSKSEYKSSSQSHCSARQMYQRKRRT